MLKCKRVGCVNKVTQRAMAYCSRACAPLGHLGADVTWSAKTEKSSTKGAGAESFRSSADDPKPESAKFDGIKTQPSPKPNARQEEDIMQETSSVSADACETSIATLQQKPEDDGRLDGWRTKQETLPAERRPTSGTVEETRLMDFIAPSPNSSAAQSLSGNLIDSTLGQLHDLMKSVAADNPRARNSPESINAVCNVAKQMRELMVLKLNVVKTARKLEEA